MRLEVVHINVFALVRLVCIAFYGLSLAIDAFDDIFVWPFLVEAVPLLVVVSAGSFVLGPSRLYFVSF